MKCDPGFAHRLNEDGTIDSICLDCFITVAHANSVKGLIEGEQCHQCADNHPAASIENLGEDREKVIKWPQSA